MEFKLTRAFPALAALALLAACGTQKPAPVVDRSSTPSSRAGQTAPAAAPSPSGTREARDGVYTVQRGDTLFSIALAFGIDSRELARINNISDPSQLTVGQSLRVRPPTDASVATVTPVAPVGSTEVRPLPLPGAAPPATTPSAPAATAPAPAAAKPPETAKPAPVESSLQWAWPAAGKVIEGFEDPRNKGIDISGAEGEPIRVAADGKVVYVGSAVRGYGNLVIVEHADEFISAYAHNRQIVVKQGQQVKRGEKIAEMGKSDADRPKLHFEIRRQGKPLDPQRYLPSR